MYARQSICTYDEHPPLILNAQQEGLETKREKDLAIVAHEARRMPGM